MIIRASEPPMKCLLFVWRGGVFSGNMTNVPFGFGLQSAKSLRVISLRSTVNVDWCHVNRKC
jgi:hypothetical protein